MIVQFKNKGSYPSYELTGTVLHIGSWQADLAALQKDYPVEITLYEDENGSLTETLSLRYAAEICIPAKVPAVEKIGIADEFGFPALKHVFPEFSADEVILTLWGKKEG